jgi:hypothetical protein
MFLEIYTRSAAHAHALCHMNKMIIKEVTKNSLEAASVVLPRVSQVGLKAPELIPQAQ